MKIKINANPTVLATKGCYCEEDIEVEAKLQEKTATANGEVVADSGFAGLGKVIVAVPEPDAKIIDVTELPTADIDDSVYYRMDGKLYKHADELSGTWLLNETITPIASGLIQFAGSVSNTAFLPGVEIFVLSQQTGKQPGYFGFIAGGELVNFYSTNAIGETYIQSNNGKIARCANKTTKNVLKLYEPTVANRTFTVTGDIYLPPSQKEVLSSWLKANAIKQTDESWTCYRVPGGSVTVTENGTVDVTNWKEVVVDVNAPKAIDVEELPASGIDKSVYYRMNGRLYECTECADPNVIEGTWLFDDNRLFQYIKKYQNNPGPTTLDCNFTASIQTEYWEPEKRIYKAIKLSIVDPEFSYYTGTTHGVPLTYSSDGVIWYVDTQLQRTVTVTSGSSDALAFLQATATKQPPEPIWVEYLTPEGTKEITENGAVDVTAFASANVNVPAKPVDIATAAEMTALLTEANVGKVYRFTGTTDDTYTNGDLYVVE